MYTFTLIAKEFLWQPNILNNLFRRRKTVLRLLPVIAGFSLDPEFKVRNFASIRP